MKKNNTLLIIMGVILIAFIVSISLTNFNLSAVATDSGFDTSYDGGDGEGDIGAIIYLIYLFIEYPIPTTIFIVILLISAVKSREKNRKYDNNLNYQMIDSRYSGTQARDILMAIYQTFYEVQIAWMNFDYNRLRELVSDELYNMYFNELQTLQLKGQRNIMEGFKINQISLVNSKEENGVIEHCANLNVSFFDYIIDSEGKVVRGNSNTYHRMTYLITVASSVKKLEFCPNCSAPLPENSICEYCGSHVQGLREMRLVKKVNIKQERVVE